MCMHEQWRLHCTSQWGQQTPLSEHVYCVVVAFKVTEQVLHESASNSVLSFNIPLQKLFRWFRGCSYWQLAIGNFIMTTCLLMHHVSCRIFWQNIKSPKWLSPLEPIFGTLWLLAFPKTKITFEREEISGHQWDSWKYDGAAGGNWENCVRSQGAHFEGDWSIIILCTMFLIFSSINVSIFHITWLETCWTELVCIPRETRELWNFI